MKKLILLLALVAISHSIVFSQGCLPEGITFTTQSQIDNFQTNYPGCTEIEGDVSIGNWMSGNNITNLEGLNVLTSIGGFLVIEENLNLVNLEGLNALTSIAGFLYIEGNSAIYSLSGLENLTSVTFLQISNNFNLTSLSGLEGLTSVEEGLVIQYNYSLPNFTGLENLTYIGDGLSIVNNEALTSLSGLENLTSIGDIRIFQNPSLIDLAGLENLVSVGGNMGIHTNSSLASLLKLESLTTIGGELWICLNNDLNSLNGLENIEPNSIESLVIYYNPILSECDVQSICEYLAAPNGTIEIHDNAPGCNSQDEVMDACYTQCLPEGITFTTQEQIDNFQTNYPGCTEIIGNLKITDWGSEITNLNGLEVLTSVGGNLEIYICHGLTSLTGLDNVTYIGGNLSIGNAYYGGNNSLNNLNGLNNLTSIGGSLGIYYHDNLQNIAALAELTFIGGGINIFGNDLLTSLSGLNNVSSIADGLQIIDNPVLFSLSGLENLTSIAGYLYIWGNDGLTNINSLINLTSVAGFIYIMENGNLSSLAGLNNIEASSIDSLKIYYNNILSDCDVQSICEFLISPNGSVNIHDNALGCNSQAEVEAACLTSLEENIIKDEITLFPNPASSFITVVAPQSQEIEEIIFYNQLGQVVLSVREATNPIKISNLTPGIYFASVSTPDRKLMTKVFIE